MVARWISDAQRERKVLVAQLGEPVPGGKLTKNQVRALVAGLRDIVSTLADADPEDKAELYRERGVNLTYSPDGRGQRPGAAAWGKRACRRGDLRLDPTCAATSNSPGGGLKEVRIIQ